LDSGILKELFEKKHINSGKISELGIASYTYQKTIQELVWLGVVTEEKSKLNVKLLDNQITSILKKVFFEGFNTKLLTKENINWLTHLLEPKTTQEIAEETKLSISQTHAKLNKFAQFITKNKKYFLSKKSLLYDFISAVHTKNTGTFTWIKGKEKLQKIPLEFESDGKLTAFSEFSEFGLAINPSHKFIYFPKKELTLEEILVHAIKFSENANDIALCMLFYLKNKNKTKVNEIEKQSEHLNVLDKWFDIVAFIEGQQVKNQELFLPKNEFNQKAQLYGIKTTTRYEQKSIQELFKETEKVMKEKIQLYFIGGNALIEHKTKNSTKDIDIVLTSEKQANILIKALKKIGFNEVGEKEVQYGLLEATAMLERKNSPRIDLFVKKVCGILEFSKNMQKRSKQIAKGKTEIFLASLEDIFLLKSISSRDSDLIDCENILQKHTLNWNTIYNEITGQEKNLSQTQELIILDHLEALENRLQIKIPITKKITILCLTKSILYLAKKPTTIKEINGRIDFPETIIRNKVTQLIKKNKLKKTKNTPFTIQTI